MQYHILLQFIYIAAICVKLLQFMYIAAICVNCCNLCILQKNFKSPFNCHGDDMLTKTVSVALSLFPWTHVVYWPEALLYWLCSVRLCRMTETCQITVTSVICPQKAGRLHPDISRSAHRYTSSQLHTVNCKIKNVKLVYRYFVTERTLTKFNPNWT